MRAVMLFDVLAAIGPAFGLNAISSAARIPLLSSSTRSGRPRWLRTNLDERCARTRDRRHPDAAAGALRGSHDPRPEPLEWPAAQFTVSVCFPYGHFKERLSH